MAETCSQCNTRSAGASQGSPWCMHSHCCSPYRRCCRRPEARRHLCLACRFQAPEARHPTRWAGPRAGSIPALARGLHPVEVPRCLASRDRPAMAVERHRDQTLAAAAAAAPSGRRQRRPHCVVRWHRCRPAAAPRALPAPGTQAAQLQPVLLHQPVPQPLPWARAAHQRETPPPLPVAHLPPWLLLPVHSVLVPLLRFSLHLLLMLLLPLRPLQPLAAATAAQSPAPAIESCGQPAEWTLRFRAQRAAAAGAAAAHPRSAAGAAPTSGARPASALPLRQPARQPQTTSSLIARRINVSKAASNYSKSSSMRQRNTGRQLERTSPHAKARHATHSPRTVAGSAVVPAASRRAQPPRQTQQPPRAAPLAGWSH